MLLQGAEITQVVLNLPRAVLFRKMSTTATMLLVSRTTYLAVTLNSRVVLVPDSLPDTISLQRENRFGPT